MNPTPMLFIPVKWAFWAVCKSHHLVDPLTIFRTREEARDFLRKNKSRLELSCVSKYLLIEVSEGSYGDAR
jgi:hypothetical protein